MAKQLLLVRHGKSDRGFQQIKDFDRPLNHKGNKNAICMAEKFLKKDTLPSLLVSSPAIRALSTAQHFSRVWDIPQEAIQEEMSVYEAGTRDLLDVVCKLPDEHEMIALFGHNPSITNFANYVSDAKISNIPTAGAVLISFDADHWAEVSIHTGTMLLFDFPKNGDEPV